MSGRTDLRFQRPRQVRRNALSRGLWPPQIGLRATDIRRPRTTKRRRIHGLVIGPTRAPWPGQRGATMQRRRNASLLTVFASASALAMSQGCGNSPRAGGNEDTALSVQALLFIKRQHTTVVKNPDGTTTVSVDVAGGNGQVLDYQRYVPGGSLNLLSPARADGTLTNLTADFSQADFNGADVSFDGKQAVFSMKRDPSDNYHIYTAQLAPGADGKFELHQKTGGAWDDITPISITARQIVFVTNQMYTAIGTRADEYE